MTYANAKAINKIFMSEKRTAKKTFRFRLKRLDKGRKIERRDILIERENPFEDDPDEIDRRTCGTAYIKSLKAKFPSIAIGEWI